MATEIDRLILRFPAQPGYLVIGRLNAAAVASAAGFDVEELDDLRLAVTEAITWLLADPDAGGEIELTLETSGTVVRLVGIRTGTNLSPSVIDDLVDAILGATVDEFEMTEEDGRERCVRLTKSRTAVDAA